MSKEQAGTSQESQDSWAWLRHPLILLIATALISGFLVPYLTSELQSQKKQAELETALVGEMSKAVAEILVATQFAMVGAASQSQADFDRAYREWEIGRTVLGAKILGITRNAKLAAAWEAFASRVTTFYATTVYKDPKRRINNLNSIAQTSQGFRCGASSRDRSGPSGTRPSASLDSAWIAAIAARDTLLMDLGNLISCVLE